MQKVKEMEVCVPVKEIINVENTGSSAISDVEENTKGFMSLKLTFILLMRRIGRAPNSIPIYSYIQ
jgi:hypothetical protein